MRTLIAADGFLTTEVMQTALKKELPEVEIRAIASTWPVPPFHDVDDVHEALGDTDELIAALADCEVAFSHTFPFTRQVIESAPKLKMITICRGGPVNVNIPAATDCGVLVSYTPGRNATATAEHTVGMILCATRQIPQRHQEVYTGGWRSDYYQFDQVGPEIGSSTVGVIGYGNVGEKVANIIASFGGEVLVFDPWSQKRPSQPNVYFVDTVEELLARSLIVTIHARVTEENREMLNAAAFQKMPSGGIVINCARGPLMNYEDLCDAIDSGHIYAAALDCLPQEPLPENHRLLHTPRITITPHLAGASKEASRLAARIGAADIARFARGERPMHLANPEVWH